MNKSMHRGKVLFIFYFLFFFKYFLVFQSPSCKWHVQSFSDYFLRCGKSRLEKRLDVTSGLICEDINFTLLFWFFFLVYFCLFCFFSRQNPNAQHFFFFLYCLSHIIHIISDEGNFSLLEELISNGFSQTWHLSSMKGLSRIANNWVIHWIHTVLDLI